MAYYAWSNIKGGTAEKPITIKRGEEVSKAKLGLSDADWEAIIESGAVRTKKFPAPSDWDGSAIGFVRQQLRDTTSMSAVEEEEAASELAKISEAAPSPAKGSASREESKDT